MWCVACFTWACFGEARSWFGSYIFSFLLGTWGWLFCGKRVFSVGSLQLVNFWNSFLHLHESYSSFLSLMISDRFCLILNNSTLASSKHRRQWAVLAEFVQLVRLPCQMMFTSTISFSFAFTSLLVLQSLHLFAKYLANASAWEYPPFPYQSPSGQSLLPDSITFHLPYMCSAVLVFKWFEVSPK